MMISSFFRKINHWQKTYQLIIGIFITVIILEYSTPPPYVFGYLYIGAVVPASLRLNRRATIWVTGMAILLTLLNLFIPGMEPITPIALTNRMITVIALLVTGWLSDRLQQYEKAIMQQRMQIAAQSQLAQVREDFVSTLTHDLKTPLLGAIETLNALQNEQFGKVTVNMSRAISIMIRSHEMTLQLVATLMDVYRNDTEGLKLNLCPVEIVTVAEEAIIHLTPLASARQVHIRLGCGDSDFRQAHWVNADVLQLQRVFSNLIANAVNHSLRGSKVQVMITAKNDYCLVQVLDEGEGINPKELPQLFERFYQGQSARSARGTGLGLYLCRQIIEAHNGKIWAESRTPRGAIFSFRLPLHSG
ncbi:MAG: HAMP domain-containing histidine kinase [Gomphosphaeria aponina SAG 52.96 = DSM 107014]|uniref:histidine kinase n=1 Tax=Gomphosphaeria aponina SAG 52.96 = DSM 107014 TaxID=1521640 RepID=A0A941GUB9_9CHRO|nr:HAMP domain-containing histidine kinase [Gomphosphaeria aponina SAG 52.96 = DSM 107014]